LEKGDLHWSGGFRDLAFKVKVGFQVLAVVAVFRSINSLNRFLSPSLSLQDSSCGTPRFVPMYDQLRAHRCSTIFAAFGLRVSHDLICFALKKSLGSTIRQDPRLRAADPSPST
jgi:hypothetical protein